MYIYIYTHSDRVRRVSGLSICHPRLSTTLAIFTIIPALVLPNPSCPIIRLSSLHTRTHTYFVRHLLDQSNRNLETPNVPVAFYFPVRSAWRKSFAPATKRHSLFSRGMYTRNASRACRDFAIAARGGLYSSGKARACTQPSTQMWPVVNVSARFIPSPLFVHTPREYTCPVSCSSHRTRNRAFQTIFRCSENRRGKSPVAWDSSTRARTFFYITRVSSKMATQLR